MAVTGNEPVTIEQLKLWQDKIKENGGFGGGKSAYDSAVEGGFVGDETTFNQSLASIGNLNTILDNINGEVI